MQNQLILFNPYYKADVIEQHLNLLIENGKVAFGKIRSTLRTMEHHFENELEEIYESIDDENYLQLFLTDYSNIYVAKVVQVTGEDLTFSKRYYIWNFFLHSPFNPCFLVFYYQVCKIVKNIRSEINNLLK